MEGGARAFALEPVRDSASRGASSRQTMLLVERYGATRLAGSGVLAGVALALKPQQSTQLASWLRGWPPWSLPLEDGSFW